MLLAAIAEDWKTPGQLGCLERQVKQLGDLPGKLGQSGYQALSASGSFFTLKKRLTSR